MFNNDAWLDQVTETTIDPAREIIDPHHHLWQIPELLYDLKDLQADTGAGHNIIKTVFMECGSSYRSDGPEHMKCVGETEYIAARAAQSNAADNIEIAGIIAHADLTNPALDDVLDAHLEASNGLLRGIRHAGAWSPHPEALTIPPPAPQNLYAQENFREGVARLGERGLTYDTWHYHPQNLEFQDLAKAVPGTTMVLDHFGTPLGVGPYAGKREEIFAQWKDDIAAIAACPNVVAKLGGLAMPDNGFGWMGRELPPTSDEFVEAQARYYHHAISCFGADRCMFESNFPVDRLSINYNVLWNGLKKIASGYSETEQEMMFKGTAARVYRL
ncbi:amidohydrolase family protein [Kordiimonas aquimaris]|uniref:amidohydrolase family protein n=1 Tax=Kordiimonas aquimaris TaxID=707591 RepID=UPI0021D3B96D|nr:amidohydrolase family protein [Kordiimonas aquimaris]